jgi:N-acetylmuramoyl-L-alanine amidase
VSSFLRALTVVVAVTVAGTALPSTADSTGSTPPASPSVVEASRPTASTHVQQVAPSTTPAPTTGPASTLGRTAAPARRRPLRAVTIALDPGHQLGNHNYPRQTNALVPAGGFSKPCNTTGTATDGGVAEATVDFALAKLVKKRLRRLGARVPMTRTVNSERLWGPCVDARGAFGKRVGARLMVSLHADGASSSGRGFHVIAPADRSPWTDDIAAPSLRLATALRNGLTGQGIPRSDYVAGGSGLDVRSDLGTLNLSDVPVAMIEIGNMRNAGDARRMTTRAGRAQYARAVVRGIRAYLGK